MVIRRVLLALMYSLLAGTALTQVPAESIRALEVRQIWQNRAAHLSSLIEKDTSRLDELDQAALHTDLAASWHKVDRDKALSHATRCVDILFFYSSSDFAKNRSRYLEVSAKAIGSIRSIDERQSRRLLKILSDREKRPTGPGDIEPEKLIELALAIVEGDPEAAGRFGISALSLGQPSNLHQLYWQLRLRRGSSADSLLAVGLNSARSGISIGFLASLKQAVFPELVFGDSRRDLASTPIQRRDTAIIFSEALGQRFAALRNGTVSNCRNEAIVLAPVTELLPGILPAYAPAFRQAINACLERELVDSNDVFSRTPRASSTNTVEELLRLADESKDDLNARVYFLLRAATLANDKELYEFGLKILEQMSEDERSLDVESWQELQYTLSAGFAFSLYRDMDTVRARNILNALPDKTRPLGKIGFVLMFDRTQLPSCSLCLETIEEASVEISRSTIDFDRKVGYWMRIVDSRASYLDYQGAQETLAALVKAYEKNLDEKGKADPGQIAALIEKSVTAPLLQAQDAAIIGHVMGIGEVKTRVPVLHSLLKVSLKEILRSSTEML